ncbi:MAG: hypothetical protein D6796_11390 [Caldilineae bacterium]|nr:MAG: hypothetical protein D6796_11390 [Caldilineae bacterium]
MQTQEVTAVVCPQCQTRYNAPVITIINVTQHPELKAPFLQQQLNISRCPRCGLTQPLNLPLLYYDGEKELAFALVPNNLGLSHLDEQKIIGDLTNRLINTLPAEARKGYLFTPKTFLTLDSLIKAVLAADGITEEVLETRRARMQLFEQLAKAGSQEAFQNLLDEHRAELDEPFFELVTAIILQALQTGDEAAAQNLLNFRQVIAASVEGGQELTAAADRKFGLTSLTPESLLTELQNAATEDEFIALIATARPMLDYTFFQNLTAQIDAARKEGETEKAQTLKALRTRILEAAARLDDEAHQKLAQVEKLLDTLLKAPNPKQAVQEHLQQIDDVLLNVLVARYEQASQQGQQESARKLGELYTLIANALSELAPPEIRLLDRLLSAATPDAVRRLLEENRALLTPDFFAFLDSVQEQFRHSNQPALAERVAQIAQMAKSL